MKKVGHIIGGIVFAASFGAGCASQHPSSVIASAEEALGVSDFQSAQSLCDNLAEVASADTLALFPSQYCRVAMIYMTLAEHQGKTDVMPDDNIASAVVLFSHALDNAPDSVAAFLDGLAPEDAAHAQLLIQLSEAADTRGMIYGEMEETDDPNEEDHVHNH